MGLSRADFSALTREEFTQTFEIWRQNSEARYRSEWEQTRFVAACTVMPHSKRIRQPRDLITFEWEKEKGERKKEKEVTREAHLRRIEELEKRWG